MSPKRCFGSGSFDEEISCHTSSLRFLFLLLVCVFKSISSRVANILMEG